MTIERVPSPNFNDRQYAIDMLVLHYTGMETGEAALERLCDPDAAVSAHYLIFETGRTLQLVDEDKRAWHAGVSSWQGDDDLNSRSIGIEIVNGGHDCPAPDGGLPVYPDAQIEAVIALCEGILRRHGIPQTRIVGHSDIAPERKQDPGEHFPWPRLALADIGLSPATEDAAPSKDPAVSLRSIGYETRDLRAALLAFQRRWVPRQLTGEADTVTMALLGAVEAAYSASRG